MPAGSRISQRAVYPSGFRPKEMTENRIRLPRIGYEYRLMVSPDGKAAYSYEDAIALLKFKSGEVDYYEPPAAMFTFMPQGFPDEETLLVFVRNKKAQSSWLLKTGGDQ